MVDELGLRELLDLEEIDVNIYRGQNETSREERLFGGQVLAQGLVAAGRTVDGLLAHSLHAYFLRPGDPKTPVLYTVDRIRDGRSFTTRRVVAVQSGRAILNMSASFHKLESGYEHQIDMPAAPDPESLPDWRELLHRYRDRIPEARRDTRRGSPPIDFRFVDLPMFLGGDPSPTPNQVWMRAPGPLPEDRAVHQAFLTYATDMSLIDTVLRRHGRSGELGPVMGASLDHAVWFHRPFRVDEWLLYVQDSPAAAGARGFARGSIFTQGGQMIASVAQEGLVRPIRQKSD